MEGALWYYQRNYINVISLGITNNNKHYSNSVLKKTRKAEMCYIFYLRQIDIYIMKLTFAYIISLKTVHRVTH